MYVSENIIANHLPSHGADVHKYQRGKVLMWVGSEGMSGAASLCAKAAYLAGAGYVGVYTEPFVMAALAVTVPEAVCNKFQQDDQVADVLRGSENGAMLIGSGLQPNNANAAKMFAMIKASQIPLVIDAGGLTMLCENLRLIKKAAFPPILTPHSGEFARLIGGKPRDFGMRRAEYALEFAQKYNCVVVLKGAESVIAAPDGRVALNPHVNAKMATAGAGDVLSGIIVAFLAQKADAYWSAAMGCYVHGYAGNMASNNGNRYILASQICENIAGAIENIEIRINS